MARTPRVNRLYSDLDLDFLAHPTTKDVLKKTGVEAIKRSIRNLVLTNFYDRKFQHHIGSNAVKMLFDNVSPLLEVFLRDAIIEVIENFEPRVHLVDNEHSGVFVQVDPDKNGYNVRIEFIVVNTGERAYTGIFLERIR
jgi:phage baseplate assembly protein W